MASRSAVAEAARPILGIERQSGAFVALVPSCSQPGAYHVVTADGRCDCKSFTYRKRCRHVGEPESEPLADGGQAHVAVMRMAGDWPAASTKATQQARTYREIFGGDE